MHTAGFLHTDGTPDARGGYGYYWSSNQQAWTEGYLLQFYEWEFGPVCNIYYGNKAMGSTVRCIK